MKLGTCPFLPSQHICTTDSEEFGNILSALEGRRETDPSFFPSSPSIFLRLRTRWEMHGLGSKFITSTPHHLAIQGWILTILYSTGQPSSFNKFSQFEGCCIHSSGTMPIHCQYPIFLSSCMMYQAEEKWFSSWFEGRAKEFGTGQELTCGEEEGRKGNACSAREKFSK